MKFNYKLIKRFLLLSFIITSTVPHATNAMLSREMIVSDLNALTKLCKSKLDSNSREIKKSLNKKLNELVENFAHGNIKSSQIIALVFFTLCSSDLIKNILQYFKGLILHFYYKKQFNLNSKQKLNDLNEVYRKILIMRKMMPRVIADEIDTYYKDEELSVIKDTYNLKEKNLNIIINDNIDQINHIKSDIKRITQHKGFIDEIRCFLGFMAACSILRGMGYTQFGTCYNEMYNLLNRNMINVKTMLSRLNTKIIHLINRG